MPLPWTAEERAAYDKRNREDAEKYKTRTDWRESHEYVKKIGMTIFVNGRGDGFITDKLGLERIVRMGADILGLEVTLKKDTP